MGDAARGHLSLERGLGSGVDPPRNGTPVPLVAELEERRGEQWQCNSLKDGADAIPYEFIRAPNENPTLLFKPLGSAFTRQDSTKVQLHAVESSNEIVEELNCSDVASYITRTVSADFDSSGALGKKHCGRSYPVVGDTKYDPPQGYPSGLVPTAPLTLADEIGPRLSASDMASADRTPKPPKTNASEHTEKSVTRNPQIGRLLSATTFSQSRKNMGNVADILRSVSTDSEPRLTRGHSNKVQRLLTANFANLQQSSMTPLASSQTQVACVGPRASTTGAKVERLMSASSVAQCSRSSSVSDSQVRESILPRSRSNKTERLLSTGSVPQLRIPAPVTGTHISSQISNDLDSGLQSVHVCRDSTTRCRENSGERDDAMGITPSLPMDSDASVYTWQVNSPNQDNVQDQRDISSSAYRDADCLTGSQSPSSKTSLPTPAGQATSRKLTEVTSFPQSERQSEDGILIPTEARHQADRHQAEYFDVVVSETVVNAPQLGPKRVPSSENGLNSPAISSKQKITTLKLSTVLDETVESSQPGGKELKISSVGAVASMASATGGAVESPIILETSQPPGSTRIVREQIIYLDARSDDSRAVNSDDPCAPPAPTFLSESGKAGKTAEDSPGEPARQLKRVQNEERQLSLTGEVDMTDSANEVAAQTHSFSIFERVASLYPPSAFHEAGNDNTMAQGSGSLISPDIAFNKSFDGSSWVAAAVGSAGSGSSGRRARLLSRDQMLAWVGTDDTKQESSSSIDFDEVTDFLRASDSNDFFISPSSVSRLKFEDSSSPTLAHSPAAEDRDVYHGEQKLDTIIRRPIGTTSASFGRISSGLVEKTEDIEHQEHRPLGRRVSIKPTTSNPARRTRNNVVEIASESLTEVLTSFDSRRGKDPTDKALITNGDNFVDWNAAQKISRMKKSMTEDSSGAQTKVQDPGRRKSSSLYGSSSSSPLSGRSMTVKRSGASSRSDDSIAQSGAQDQSRMSPQRISKARLAFGAGGFSARRGVLALLAPRSSAVARAGPDVPEAARTEFTVAYPVAYTADLLATVCQDSLGLRVFRRTTGDKLRVERADGDGPHLVAAVTLQGEREGVTHVRIRMSQSDRGRTTFASLWTFYDDLVTQLEMLAHDTAAAHGAREVEL
jgi:hypothetical protein